MTDSVKLISDEGKGQTIVVCYEHGSRYSNYPSLFKDNLVSKFRTIVIELPRITALNWKEVVKGTEELQGSLQIRLSTFLSFGAACSIIQMIALQSPKLVKAMILFDPTSRAHPTAFTNFVDSIEKRLPLGLPLRSNIEELDTKPFLHRLRLPSLIVSTSNATSYEKSEAELISDSIPTAWSMNFEDGLLVSQNSELLNQEIDKIISFQNISPKCSMRAKGR